MHGKCGKNQFDRLYNTLNDDGRTMHKFYNKLYSRASDQYRIINVEEVSAAASATVHKHKCSQAQ